MTTRFLIAALLFAAAPLAAQGGAPITEFTAAGIPVILKRVEANDVIAVRLYLRGGAAALTPATAGIERLIGGVSTHGTQKYTRDQFVARSTETGTNIGVDTDYDFTVYAAQAVRQHWEEAWDLFTQAALHPTFPAAAVEQVQAQLVDEIQQRPDVPDNQLPILADSVLYARHAYSANPQGSAGSVSRLTRDDLVAWHRRRFTRANLLLVIVGNVTPEDVTAKIEAAFGALPATGGEAPVAPVLTDVSRDVVTVKRELPTNYVMGVFAAPSPDHPDYPAFRAATRVLGENMFEEVRTKRNLSYAVSAQLGTRTANRGALYVTAVDPDTTLKIMLNEVRRIQRRTVEQERLSEAVAVYATQFLMGQQTNMGQAAELGGWEISGGGWENAGRFIRRMRMVTPADVQRVANIYFKNARFVVIGDPAKVDRTLFTSL